MRFFQHGLLGLVDGSSFLHWHHRTPIPLPLESPNNHPSLHNWLKKVLVTFPIDIRVLGVLPYGGMCLVSAFWLSCAFVSYYTHSAGGECFHTYPTIVIISSPRSHKLFFMALWHFFLQMCTCPCGSLAGCLSARSLLQLSALLLPNPSPLTSLGLLWASPLA